MVTYKIQRALFVLNLANFVRFQVTLALVIQSYFFHKYLLHVHAEHESRTEALSCREAIYRSASVVNDLLADKEAHAKALFIDLRLIFLFLKLAK